jgi:hypothetical protein
LFGKHTTQDFIFYNYEVGKSIIFYTAPTTAGTVVEAMRIQSNGLIKIPGLTASRLVLTNANDELVSSTTTVTDTQLGHLAGVTSPIQTQLNGKQATLTAGAGIAISASNEISVSSNGGWASNTSGIFYNPSVVPVGSTAHVGIGTSAPNVHLHVVGKLLLASSSSGVPANGLVGGAGHRILFGSGTSSSTPTGLGVDSGTLVLWYCAQGTHRWYNGTTNTMTLDPNGILAINTTSPDTNTKLHVNGKVFINDGLLAAPVNGVTGGNGARIILWPGGSSSCPYAFGMDGNTLWYVCPSTAAHRWYNGTTNTMTLSSTGALTVSGGYFGVLRPNNDTWHQSAEGRNRLWFSNNSITFFGGVGYVWRRSDDAQDLMTLTNAGNLSIVGSLGTGNITITGNTNNIPNGLYINTSSPTIYLQDSDNISSMIHCNSSIFYILKGTANNSTTWSAFTNTRWPLQIDLTNGYTSIGGSLDIHRDSSLFVGDWRIFGSTGAAPVDLNFRNVPNGEQVAISWVGSLMV